MAYNNNIPLANQRIKDSQQPINDNFAAIETLIMVNHGDFGTASQGKHLFLSMPSLVASPPTAAGERAVYAKTSALTSAPELFVRAQSNGTEYEFTSALDAATGWTRLPSGILLKWGVSSANGDATYVFPVAGTIPVFTAIYVVLLNPIAPGAGDPNHAITLKTQSTVNFTVYGSPRVSSGATNVGFEYLALGI